MVTKKAATKKTAAKTATRAAKQPATPVVSDWRPALLDRMRSLIVEAVPGVTEEIKWRKPSNPGGVPVWSLNGIICTGETYKTSVKLTFMQGAALPDPSGLFNAGQDGGTRRAIDLREGDTVNARAFKAVVKAAAAHNAAGKKG
jgi:hypothetical protein